MPLRLSPEPPKAGPPRQIQPASLLPHPHPVCSFFRHFKVNPRQQLLKEARFTLTQPSSEGHASRRAGPPALPQNSPAPGLASRGSPSRLPPKCTARPPSLRRPLREGEDTGGAKPPHQHPCSGTRRSPRTAGRARGPAGRVCPGGHWLEAQQESEGAQSWEGQLRPSAPAVDGEGHAVAEVGPVPRSPPHASGNH